MPALIIASPAPAQCPFDWRPGDGIPGTNGPVTASTMWDPDGAGPQPPVLVLGGAFSVAGSVAANSIAVWDTTSWGTLGGGMNGDVRALTVYHGSLIAGGDFTSADGASANHIAQWDGQSWSALGAGMPGTVRALTVYNGNLIAG